MDNVQEKNVTGSHSSQPIRDCIKRMRDGEVAKLDELYRQSPQTLRQNERDVLIKQSLDLRIQVEDEMKRALTESGVAYSSFAWQKIFEGFQQLSYRYIDWNSINAQGQGIYEHQVNQREFDEVQSGKSYLPWISGIATGTVALVVLKVTNLALSSVVNILVTAAAAGGGYVVGKIISPPSQENPTKRTKTAPEKDNTTALIETTRKLNRNAAAEWFQHLEERALRVWEEAEKT